MRRIFTYLIALMATTAVWAQHLDFCGVEIAGPVRNITEPMRKAGFKLQEKRTDQYFYIFEGKYCGQMTYLNVNYTPKSKTVYQVRVTPRAVNETALRDSLIAKYGDEYEETADGMTWANEKGGIFYIKKEGYDPYIILLDTEGATKMMSEKK